MREETMKLLEDCLVSRLEAVNNCSADDESRRIFHKEAIDLAEKIIAAEHDAYEYYDKEDRRSIEREKIEAAEKLEKVKADINWKRLILEVGKIAGPVAIAILGHRAYDKYQTRVMEYEKDGTIRTTAGRSLHLPKIL